MTHITPKVKFMVVQVVTDLSIEETAEEVKLKSKLTAKV